MALVLVVMLLLTSVASVVAATSVRNIQTGGGSFAQERARLQAESSSRKQAVVRNHDFYQYLKALKSDVHDVPDEKESAAYFWDLLVSWVEDYYSSYAGPAGSLEIVVSDTPEPTKFTVSISSSVDGQTVTSEIRLTVDYGTREEQIEPVEPETEPQIVTIRTVTLTSVEYSTIL